MLRTPRTPTTSGDVALVVPSNRPERLPQFLARWGRAFDRVVVVYDGPSVTDPLRELEGDHDNLTVLSWADIDSFGPLGKDAFGRRDASVRQFGVLRALEMGCDYVATTDDDCLPDDLPQGDPIRAYVGFGTEGRVPDEDFPATAFVDRHLINLLDVPAHADTLGLNVPYCARGLPYHNVGRLRVGLSVGLWTGTPDVDASTALAVDPEDLDREDLDGRGDFIAPAFGYVPVSSMNYALPNWAAPAVYLPPQGPDTPYARFDDIWGGQMAQRIFRQAGLSVSVGRPYVHHTRASNAFANLVKEAPGVVVNEYLWELLDALKPEPVDATLNALARAFGTALRTMAVDDADLLRARAGGDALVGYLVRWGYGLERWCDLVKPHAPEYRL